MVPVPHLRPNSWKKRCPPNARRKPGGMAMMETTDMMCLETPVGIQWG